MSVMETASDILANVVPPQSSYCISLENGHTRALSDMVMNKYKMGYIHDRIIGVKGTNSVHVSRLFDLVTYISCDADVRDMYLVIMDGGVDPATKIFLTDHLEPYQRFRICNDSSLPKSALYGTFSIEYTSESDHSFTVHGSVLSQEERMIVSRGKSELSIGDKRMVVSGTGYFNLFNKTDVVKGD
jgi:hypothetical protein